MADDAGGSNPINALTASQTVLDCFWNLALPEEAKRLAAAESLVKELVDRQREHAQAAGVGAQQDAVAPLTAEELQQLPKPKRQEAALSRCSPLMVYALRRLIRGLGSGRQGARQGFATALALLLRQQCEQQPAAGGGAGGNGDQQPPLFVDAMDVLALLETCLETGGGSVKQGETRDNLVGRLFGYGALVQSGLLTRGSPGAATAPAAAGTAPGTGSKAKAGKPGKAAAAAAAVPAVVADIGPCVACVKAVLALGSSKSFLREAAAKTVLELAWALGPAGAARLVEGSAELQAMISVEPKDATPEALLLALCLWPVLGPALAAAAPLPRGCPAPPPSALFPASPQLPGQSHDRWALSGPEAPPAACTDAIFNTQYIQSVLPALLATTSANPHLHSLWCALLPLLLPGARAQGAAAPAGPTTPPTAPATAAATPAMRHVEALWSCVVEQSLLPSPSHERKFLAFKLFQILLPHLGPDHVPVVLSKSFSKVLVNNLSKKDNYLHAAARRCMDALASFAEGGDADGSVSAADGGVSAPAAGGSTRLAVAAALQQLGIKLPSAAKQQQQPGGKKVVSAVAVLDAAGVSSYLAHMMQSFLNAGRQDGAGEAAPKGVAAAVQAQQAALSARARRKAQAAKGEEEDGEEAGEAAGEDAAARAETQRAHAVEQLCTAVRFPAAPAEDVERVARFLATHALFEVAPGGAEGSAEEKAAATPGKSEKKKKKQRQAVPHEVAAAAAMAAPVSPTTRRLCAQRLVALAGWLATAHRTQNKKQQQQQQQQQQAAAEPKGAVKQDGDGKAGAESQQQQQQQTVDGPKVLGSALAYVHGLAAAAAQPGAPAALVLPLDGERDVALTLLREVEVALAEAAAAADPAAAAAGDGGRAAAARRGLLQLVRMLQLHALADPEGVEPELALGLRRVACEGLGAELPDLKAEAAEEEEESEEEEGGKGKEDGKGKAAPWQDVLVDVMLSLLSRPAAALPIAPLREAVEAAWRGLAWSLTGTGMRDLVRVVATGPEEAGAAGEVLEEEDEEVEEDEDEHSEDEVEEEEEEEEEGSGKQKKGEEGKKKGKAAGKESKGKKEDGDEEEGDEEEGSEGGDGDEEESEEEEEEADDAEMFRMDAKMAAYLRATVDARKGAADRRAALANLRLRALSLIEAYAKKVPGSPLLLLALTPMTRALIIARRAAVQHRGGGDLSGRLAAVLTGLCRQVAPPPAAAAPLAMPLDELLGCLRRMQRAACNERERGAAAAAAAAWAALLRAAAAAPDEAPRAAAADAYRSALSHLLTKKGTRLHRSTLEEAAKGAPGAALSALPEVMRACVSARNAHMQHEALQLLASFFAVRRQQPKQRQQHAAAKREGTAAAAVKGAPEGDPEAPIAAAVMEHRQALGAALVAATAGVGMKKDQHTAALKAAVFVLEGLRRIFNKKRLAEVLGAECINGLAKAVVTVKDLGVLPKVSAQLDRLVATTSLSDLLAKTEPDPALRSKLNKAQAKLQQQQAAAAEKAAQKKAQRAAGQAGGEGGEKGKRERRKGKEGKEKAGGKKEGKEGKGKQEKKGKEGGKQKGGEKGEKKRKTEGGQEGAAEAAAKRKDEGEASAAQQRNKGKQGKVQEADEGQQQRKKQKKQEGQEQAGTSEPAEQQPEQQQQQQQQQKSQKKRKGQEQGTVAEAQQQQEQQQPESDQKSKKAKKQGKRAAADGEGSDAAVAAAVMVPQESGKKAKKQKSSS